MYLSRSPKLRSSKGRRHSTDSQGASLLLPDIALEPLPRPASVNEDDEDEEDSEFADAPTRQTTVTDEDPHDNSIYPQVRASVSPTDNVQLSISTPRMWALALLFAISGSAANLIFSLRYPSVAITPVIALVLAHPLGKAWDRLLKRAGDPDETFVDGWREATMPGKQQESRWPRRLRLWLAQGRWNEKEHACVYVGSNVSFGFAFATDIIVEQHKFYGQSVPLLYQILLTISSQVLGYTFAGLARGYVVRPASMIWPGTLMPAAMLGTLHGQANRPAAGWTVSRWTFFLVVWAASFAWYFFPGLIVPALSSFNVLTWFAPDNTVIASLFGVRSGLGLLPLTFDWAHVAYIGSPLLTPWWAAANVLAGIFVVMWLLAPLLYYTNTLYSAYMPILSSAVFDNQGHEYNVSKILTDKFQLDPQAYRDYSPIYLPVTYWLSYGVQFASLTSLVSHTYCWHGSDIWRQTKELFRHPRDPTEADYIPVNQDSTQDTDAATSPHLSRRNPAQADVHNRLMQRYEDVPMVWYGGLLAGMLAAAIFVVVTYPVYLPWYGLLLAVCMAATLFVPVAMVNAVTNQHISLYLASQLVCGAAFPGRPVANMLFVAYCYISAAQGVRFASDLKLGQYAKVPPRTLFRVQVVATLAAAGVQVGVLNWLFAAVADLCTVDAANGFSCPIARVHFNGSILWGVVGPARFFGPAGLYRHLVWAFPLGFAAPLVAWRLASRPSASPVWARISFPVMFGTLAWMPPATGLNFSVWALVCYAFNHVIRRRAPDWWAKYTMTLSAALDFGLASGVILVFFLFQRTGFMSGFSWWGTEVFKQGCDWKACPYEALPPGSHFGP